MNNRTLHYIVFLLLLASTVIGWSWLWGLLFIFWTIPAYFSGSIFFIDMVERKKEPLFYWAILLTWLLLGVMMVLGDIPMLQAYLTT